MTLVQATAVDGATRTMDVTSDDELLGWFALLLATAPRPWSIRVLSDTAAFSRKQPSEGTKS